MKAGGLFTASVPLVCGLIGMFKAAFRVVLRSPSVFFDTTPMGEFGARTGELS